MALHPLAARLLQRMEASGLPSFDQMGIAEARQAFAIFEGLGGTGPEVAEVLDLRIPGQHEELAARLYIPDAEGPYPTVLWCHGGGWVLGNLVVADAYCRWLCNEAKCAVLSIDFRLAPSYPFPAPVQDCYAAASYLKSNATSMGLDPDRLAIAGESTGANLALATALVARDQQRVKFTQQVLFYPVVDPGVSSASTNEYGSGYFFTANALRWFWSQYTPTPEKRANKLADLLHVPDLAGLPPALVITAECDPTRDEGEALADKMRAAGVEVESERYEGMIHGFLGLEDMFESAIRAYQQAARALNASWGR